MSIAPDVAQQVWQWCYFGVLQACYGQPSYNQKKQLRRTADRILQCIDVMQRERRWSVSSATVLPIAAQTARRSMLRCTRAPASVPSSKPNLQQNPVPCDAVHAWHFIACLYQLNK
ncbi:hypothetical protein ABBQ38_000568 [Trebouxia sp. C0009 RCD-2024]